MSKVTAVLLAICICMGMSACENQSKDPIAQQTAISNYLLNHDFSTGLGAFSATDWRVTDSGVENTACGWDAQLAYNVRSNLDERTMEVCFVAKTDNVHLVIGNKGLESLGTSAFYGVDFATKKLQMYLDWSGDVNTPPAPHETELSIDLVAGREYILKYEHSTAFRSRVTLCDVVSGIEESLALTKHSCLGWDSPCIIALDGTVEVTSVQYYHTMPVATKLAVFGDSFVECSGLGFEHLNKRYVQLMEDAIGEDIFIDGRGGERVAGVLEKYETDALCNAEYTLLAVGTNNYNYDAWLKDLQALIHMVEEKSSVPILVTISRRTDVYDNLTFLRQANHFVRTSGYYYLDVAKAISLNNDGETIDPELYFADNVHPNLTGHQAIFNQSLVDLPFLYEENKAP